MDKQSYIDLMYEAICKCDDKLARSTLDNALSDVSQKLTGVVNSYNSKDLPLVIGAMNVISRSLTSTLGPGGISLVSSFEKGAVGIVIARKRENGGDK